MTRSHTVTANREYNKLLHAIVFTIAMLSISLHGPMSRVAHAGIVVAPHDGQVYCDVDLESHERTLAISDKRPPRRLRFKYVAETSIYSDTRPEQHHELQR